jgi:hypothetical protein
MEVATPTGLSYITRHLGSTCWKNPQISNRCYKIYRLSWLFSIQQALKHIPADRTDWQYPLSNRCRSIYLLTVQVGSIHYPAGAEAYTVLAPSDRTDMQQVLKHIPADRTDWQYPLSNRCWSIPAKEYTCWEDGWVYYQYAGAGEYSITVDKTGGKYSWT